MDDESELPENCRQCGYHSEKIVTAKIIASLNDIGLEYRCSLAKRVIEKPDGVLSRPVWCPLEKS